MILAQTTTNDELFGGVNDFFDSGAWLVIRNMTIFFVAIFWLATAFWVFKDARRRIEDPWLVGTATLLGLLAPFIGAIIYLFLRPPEYIDDVRERELEIKAMEDRLSRRDLHCPVCRAQVESSFLVCPVCTTRLKQACVKCNAPLEALWQICPHCATPVATPSLPGIDTTVTETWTAPAGAPPSDALDAGARVRLHRDVSSPPTGCVLTRRLSGRVQYIHARGSAFACPSE